MINSLKNKLTLTNSQVFFFFIFTIAAVIFQIIPAYNIGFGVYKWHFTQPETIQGGLELCVVFILLCLTSVIFKRKSYIYIYLLITIFYLWNHQVLEPFLLAIIYFEVIILLGRALVRKFNTNNEESIISKLIYFIIGLTVWSFFAIIFSMVGYGNFNDLRLLTVILGIISLVANWRFGLTKPLSLTIIQSISRLDFLERSFFNLLSIIILIELAKSNTAFDYDSIWYGLRPEKVLIGENSFFDSLGFVDFVYYYPKLFELFIAPVSNLGDFSFIYSTNVLIFGFIMLLIYRFSILLGGNKKESLFISLLISSLPVVANMASTAKTDIFTTFLLILGTYCLYEWLQKTNQIYYLLSGLIALMLSLGGKLTSIVYIPFIVLGFILTILYKVYINKTKKQYFYFKERISEKKNIQLFLLLFTSLLVIVGTCYRTFKLTGFPIYPAFGGLWERIGFQAKYPLINKEVGETFEIVDLLGIIKRWYLLFFDPKTFGHVIMLWVGNLSAFLFIIILLYVIKRKFSVNISLPIILMLLPVCLIGIFFGSFFPKGGDANYYLPAIILGLILLTHLVFNIANLPKLLIYLILMLFIPVQLSIMFVSHPSWSWGTSKFNINLSKPINDTITYKENVFKFQGIFEIEQYIINNKSTDRCIGFGSEQLMNLLSCKFEDIPHLASSHLGNQNLVNDETSFYEYLKWSKVRFIIMPNEKTDGFPYVRSVIDKYEKDPRVITILSKKYYLLDLKNTSN